MNKKNNLEIYRSRDFVGQLNKNWLKQNVPRYQISLGEKRAIIKNFGKVKNLTSTSKELKAGKRVKLRSNTGSGTLNTELCMTKKSYELEKIILHASSGKLIQFPNNSTIIDLAFSTISGQTPTKIYSRKSIAGFKLSKYALLGAKSTLRNLAKYEFYYKLYFLGSSEPNAHLLARQFKISLGEQKNYLASNGITSSLPIKNVFLFNELDSLDYDTFSSLTGFEIHLINRCL